MLRPVHTCGESDQSERYAIGATATLDVHICSRHERRRRPSLAFLVVVSCWERDFAGVLVLTSHSIQVLWQDMTSGALAFAFCVASDSGDKKWSRPIALVTRGERRRTTTAAEIVSLLSLLIASIAVVNGHSSYFLFSLTF